MRAVVCRVSAAAVRVDGQTVGEIAHGLLVYVGVARGDGEEQMRWMAEKLPALRIFPDGEGKMNRSVKDVAGGMLLIPNFTLAGRTSKGTRPSFTHAADPEEAKRLFEKLVAACGQSVTVAQGVFGAHMVIDATNDGPVTLVIDRATGEG
jgi:D-tyrosyl-tRNA(Tyr) deacylase